MTQANINMPSLSVDGTISHLSRMYSEVISNGKSPKILPSVMLWGPPGIGKSQAVRQIGKRIEEKTHKEVRITDVRLLLFNPIDLRGIPTANADKTLAIWLKPQIFQMDDSNDVVNILFLDEISAAPQSVQAAAYQITLDRVVGEHRLPDNCIVIAAGNRVTDKSVAFKMPKALANRLCHIEVIGSFTSWKKWAISHGVNDKVIGFLSFRTDYLNAFDNSKDDLAFATPRSWEMVSNILNEVDDDPETVYPLICGCVGSAIAVEFRYWCTVYRNLPVIEDIFAGRAPAAPTKPDALFALVSAMTAYAREHKDDLTGIGYSLDYSAVFSSDFSMLLVTNYLAIEPDYKTTLMQVPAFREIMKKKGAALNGLV